MYSMKNIDSKEFKTAKGVNIATEFKELKDTLFNKKLLRQKEFRVKSTNLDDTKSTKYLFLMTKHLF